jgi:hypothetical protein
MALLALEPSGSGMRSTLSALRFPTAACQSITATQHIPEGEVHLDHARNGASTDDYRRKSDVLLHIARFLQKCFSLKQTST